MFYCKRNRNILISGYNFRNSKYKKSRPVRLPCDSTWNLKLASAWERHLKCIKLYLLWGIRKVSGCSRYFRVRQVPWQHRTPCNRLYNLARTLHNCRWGIKYSCTNYRAIDRYVHRPFYSISVTLIPVSRRRLEQECHVPLHIAAVLFNYAYAERPTSKLALL